jgi:uncharacterized protein YdeI (YjbR/CyaY-like superfamily)
MMVTMQEKIEQTGIQNDNFDFRLIFEKSRKNTFKKCPKLPDALARVSFDIPELSELEMIHHYLSKLNFVMDTGMYEDFLESRKSNIELPSDMKKALKENKKPGITSTTLPSPTRRQYILWVIRAKRGDTRQRRIERTLNFQNRTKNKI